MKTRAKKTKAETYEWLLARTRLGRRIERLSWRRLARIYWAGGAKARASQRSAASQSSIRRAIRREARRCGYTPSTILALHGE